MKKVAAAVASLAVAVSGLVAVATTATASPVRAAAAPPTAAAPPASRGVVRYTPPPLVWHPCDDPTLAYYGSECSTLTVPLDYAHPGGATIELAVSRYRHTSSASDYQGVMLTNPGGPGSSGLILSVLGSGGYVPGDSDLAYDWIGLDPRGVGSSRPTLSCDSDFFGYDRPTYAPTTPGSAASWLRRSRGYAAACAHADGRRLLGHVRTTDSVEDLESLRKALGRRQVNYYGFSYGTYLGEVYATVHPARVRRFVFDGTVNPRRVWYRVNLDQDRAFETSSRVYFGWLAKYHSVYHLGATARAVRTGYYRELARLARTPAGGVIGPDELTDVLQSAAYYVYDWEDIGAAYSALVNDGDAAGVKELYDGANPQDTPGSDNSYAMYLATQCTDAPWPRSGARIRRDNVRLNRTAPFLTWSNARLNGPCRFWRAEAGRPVHVTGRRVTGQVLMIGETLDAATPFSGSLLVRRLFPTARLIEGVGGTTHAGSLSGVACTDDAIARYLADGTVPRRRPGDRSDKRCPPVPQPDPTARASSRQRVHSTRSAVPAELRRALQAAQRH